MDNQAPQHSPQFDEPTNSQPDQQPAARTATSPEASATTPPATALNPTPNNRIQIPVNLAKKPSGKKPFLIIIIIILLGGGYYLYANLAKRSQYSVGTTPSQTQEEPSASSTSQSTEVTGTTSTDSANSDSSVGLESEIKNLDSTLATINDDELSDSTLGDSEIGL